MIHQNRSLKCFVALNLAVSVLLAASIAQATEPEAGFTLVRSYIENQAKMAVAKKVAPTQDTDFMLVESSGFLYQGKYSQGVFADYGTGDLALFFRGTKSFKYRNVICKAHLELERVALPDPSLPADAVVLEQEGSRALAATHIQIECL